MLPVQNTYMYMQLHCCYATSMQVHVTHTHTRHGYTDNKGAYLIHELWHWLWELEEEVIE